MDNGKWESRIVGFAEVPPDQLLANPLNARRHPGRQRNALRASLDAVGWVAPVIVNQRTGMMIDGHARAEEALSAGLDSVPVITVDVSVEDERLLLATFDPIGSLATWDESVLDQVLELLEADPERDAMLGEVLAASRPLSDQFAAGNDSGPNLSPTASWSPGDYASGVSKEQERFLEPESNRKEVICPKCFEEFEI